MIQISNKNQFQKIYDNSKQNYGAPKIAQKLRKSGKTIYLKEQHPVRYNQLLLSGELGGYLAKLDKQAEEQLALTVRRMQKAEGVTEDLKAADQLEWVRRMNSIRNRAEEIIKSELIFV